ncbi:putative E3 ubiquitin-protein ligase herc4 [Actinomortierella ambigua]|nr:putative E3 ubiquitin-protein ligase herc4 [Actinomortierella ambigua]
MYSHGAFRITSGANKRGLPVRAFSTTGSQSFFNWLLNPKEDPIEPKQLEPLIVSETNPRLFYWDSTYSTPSLKPEFNDRIVSCLSTGIAHSCAVVDGNVHAWGSNYYSQVGLTTDSFHDDDSEEVTDVHFIHQLAEEDIVQIAAGNYHNLALSSAGKLWSWGSGCLGRGDEMYDSLPQPVEFFHALGREVRQISAAGNYSMAIARPKGGAEDDDELYVWGYIPFGELENDDEIGEHMAVAVTSGGSSIPKVTPRMRKSLQPLLVTSLLGLKIHHLACSPWHFTVAVTPTNAASSEYTGDEDSDSLDIEELKEEKPILMTFGQFSDSMPLEKPFSPMFMELPVEQEFLDIKPWRTFRSVSQNSALVIKKIVASKECDVVLMENGSIGVSDHEDHVARLIHRPLDDHIVEVAGGSSEVIAISDEGRVMAWRTPREHEHIASSACSSSSKLTKSSKSHMHESAVPEHHATGVNQSHAFAHPLDDYANKDKARAKKEVLEFFDSQMSHRQQQRPKRLVEALFETPSIAIHKPGLSKCSAQYDRFTIC